MTTWTLAQIEARIWDGLDANTPEYPEPNVLGVVNECLSKLNVVTGITQATVACAGGTVAGQLEYITPAGIIFPLRVDFNGRELAHFSLKRLAGRYRDWATDTSVTGPVARWAPIGINEFVIHPIDAVGGNVLEVTGVAPITQLSGQNDRVSLDDQYVDILVDYAKFRLPLKEGGKPFASGSLSLNAMTRKLKTMVMWRSMIWPSYWLVDQQEPAEGRGTGDR